MALKVLMLRKQKENLSKRLKELRESNDFSKREKELEDSINELDENSTDEEKEAVNEEIEKLEKEKEDLQKQIEEIENQIKEIDEKIKEEEKKQPKPDDDPEDNQNRGGVKQMTTRTKFFGMNIQERNAFFARDDVKNVIETVRTAIKEKRTIGNVGLTIPEVALPLLTEIIEKESKLKKYVHNETLKGTARQNIMGTFPEGIWVEMYGSLNELELSFNNIEADGFKVGGFFALPNAIIEDNDVDLMNKLLEALGVAISKALDKAIVYGKGVKMPLGFVTRIAQTTKPSDWSETKRQWEDLHESNVIKITGKSGLELFKEIVLALKKITNDFSSDNLVWIMNKNTHLDLQVEAMNTDMSAAIVSGLGKDTMPVVGGNVEELEFMADGDIAFGYMGLYLVVQRAEVKLSQSEHVKFIEDQTVLKGTARYDGKPVIDEAFGIMNIKGQTPTLEVLFPLDKANEADVQLKSLKVGGNKLFPAFKSNVEEYMTNTTNVSNKIDVETLKAGAKIEILNGETPVENGGNATWIEGENTLTIKVTYAGVEKTYTVIVNKTTQK